MLSLNERGSTNVVDTRAPLSTLFGDVPGQRGLSSGRANATMHFAHYAAAPKIVAAKVR